MNQPDPALPVIVKILEDGAQWERLHAIIALDEIDEMARPALASMNIQPGGMAFMTSELVIRR